MTNSYTFEGGLRTRGGDKTSLINQPLVSIITVVLNRKKHLKRAIQSVLKQSYNNIEYIILDGGSTDGSIEIIKKYDEYIFYWKSEPDKGMYYALNEGISLAKGDLIGIMHSDDFFFSTQSVNSIVEAVNKTEADIYHGDAMMVHEHERFCTFEKVISSHSRILETHASMIHPTTFFRKKVFDVVGGYDTQYKSASDYEFFIRCVKSDFSFCHVDFVISGIYNGGIDRVSNNCYSHREAYRFHKAHKTGNHQQYILSYLNCQLRRLVKMLLFSK